MVITIYILTIYENHQPEKPNKKILGLTRSFCKAATHRWNRKRPRPLAAHRTAQRWENIHKLAKGTRCGQVAAIVILLNNCSQLCIIVFFLRFFFEIDIWMCVYGFGLFQLNPWSGEIQDDSIIWYLMRLVVLKKSWDTIGYFSNIQQLCNKV